jgi:PPE-repeat protein
MTAALDFATLPPEVNSGRMYSGAGSGPMLAAASAWHGLAAELRSTALSYGSVLSALTGEEWHGPASAAMAAAAAPYAAWLGTTAEQTEQAAAQAEAAAAAYEAAFAETVPPPVIAANRTQLMALIATNILGQNTPAIAVTEAQYAEMWAQDAAAMYGYAASSAVATQLSQFTEPQQTTSPSGLSAQSAAVAQAIATPAGTQQSTMSQLMSALPTALQGLSSPASSQTPASEIVGLLTGSGSGSSTLDNLWAEWGPNANIWNTVFSSGFYMPSNTMAPFLSLLGQGTAAGDAAEAAGQAVGGAIGEAVAGPAIGGVGNAVSAGLGHAPMIGALSVPPSWTAPAPLAGPLASSLGGTPMVPPPAVAAGMPGMPIGATGAQPYGRAVPQYGFRPSFVARPPAAG